MIKRVAEAEPVTFVTLLTFLTIQRASRALALKIPPMRRIRKHTSAFTLIEILVVMALIAILVGIGVPAFTSVMEQARKTQAK